MPKYSYIKFKEDRTKNMQAIHMQRGHICKIKIVSLNRLYHRRVVRGLLSTPNLRSFCSSEVV